MSAGMVHLHAPLSEVTFQQGTDADLPEILDLWAQAWNALMPERDFASRKDWKAQRHRTMIAEGAILTLAKRGTTLIGFTLVNPINAYLDQIVVCSEEHGSGVARSLMARAKTISPQKLKLDVNQFNTRAIRFYEREDFIRSSEGVNPHSGLPIYSYIWVAKV
jgi:putative acetyltransferase